MHKDGTKFPVLMYLTSTSFSDGPATVGFILDITERKQAEEALQQSEDKYRQLTEKSVFGVFIIQDNKMVYVNPSFTKMFGYTRKEIVGTIEPRTLIHPDDVPAVRENIQKRLAGQDQPGNNEYRGVKKDGSSIYMEVHGMRIDYQGKPAVMGTMVDITDRKKTEEALRQSEEKFRVSFMTSMDAFYWSTLEDGKIIEVNPIFENVWGYTRKEVIGKTSLELGLYQDPVDREKMVSELKKKGSIKDLELKGKRKDGRLITISLSGSIMKINNQSYILGVIRDITERKQTDQQREILYQVLRAISGQLEPELIAGTAVETIVRFTGYPHVCIAIPDENGTHWTVRGAAGSLAAELGATYPIHKGVIGNAFKTGQTQWVRDITKYPGLCERRKETRRTRAAQRICCPHAQRQ